MSPTSIPPLVLSSHDRDRLEPLARRALAEGHPVGCFLLTELRRAKICAPEELPRDAVGLYRWTHYVDDGAGQPRRVRLVLPTEADIDQGQVSVLSHVGAGLIGLREGQAIRWPDPSGRARKLTPILVEDPEPLIA